jgi:hypothetical protein
VTASIAGADPRYRALTCRTALSGDGTHVKLDVLVYATGLDAHAYMRRDGLQPRRWREMDWNYRSPV